MQGRLRVSIYILGKRGRGRQRGTRILNRSHSLGSRIQRADPLPFVPTNETHMDQSTQTGTFQQVDQCEEDAKSMEDLGDFPTWIMGKALTVRDRIKIFRIMYLPESEIF